MPTSSESTAPSTSQNGLVETVRLNRLLDGDSPEEMPEELQSASRYQVENQIGHGGMGVVMAARQPAIRRQVAMKVMQRGDEGDSRLRFIEEAQITGQLQHPNIVPVHDLALDDEGRLFYTMKLVQGITLQRVLDGLKAREQPIIQAYPLVTLLTIYQKVCDAIAFAHSRGVIHRDLKPANIMVGAYGEVLVMDWGLARVMGAKGVDHPPPARPHGDESGPVTSARRDLSYCYGTVEGLVLGTPQFMSPEQSRGESVSLDGRSDIFALGTILYQMLTLEPAFEAPDTQMILERIRTGDTTPPDQVAHRKPLPHCPNGLVPQSLSAVVMKALQVDRNARYQTVEAFQKDIAAYQGGFATSAEGAGLWRQFTLLVQRHRALAVAVTASGVLLVAVSATFTAKVLGERNRAEKALDDLQRTAPRLLALAESESLAQHFESALEKTEAALALDPSLLPGYWRRAWTLVAMDRFAEAAKAVKVAAARDTDHRSLAAILPTLEALTQTSPGALPESQITPLFKFLESTGARGEALSLTRHLRLTSEQRFAMVTKRLSDLGVSAEGASVSLEGLITLNSNRSQITSLEHIRGLPVDAFYMDGRRDWDLLPLRGMKLVMLRAKNSGVRDLAPLRGMALTSLDMEGTEVSDLSPLVSMPLRFIDLSRTRVVDLTPLRGMPLEDLHVGNTPLANLEGLEKMPLLRLDIASSRITSLQPLRGMHFLQELYANNNAIVNLEGLEGLPLRSLHLMGSRVQDLTPLQKMPLETLNVSRAPIHDLSPLIGLPLRQLNVQACRQLTDFRPLLKISTLERLATNGTATQLAPLRQHPRLSHIDYKDQGYRPVAEIWAKLDSEAARK